MELSDNLMYTAMQRLVLLHYQKVLYVDLTEDFYSVLKVSDNEWNLKVGGVHSYKISEWFSFFADSDLCHDNDRDLFRSFANIENLRAMFRKNGEKPVRCRYQRKSKPSDSMYQQCVMEFFPYTDKNSHLVVFLFVHETYDSDDIINQPTFEQLEENLQFINHAPEKVKRKILVIDDNPINRSILVEYLGEEYDIVEAENGLIGLDVLFYNYRDISAVILDLYMPVIDGFEFLRRVQANPIIAVIPILVATSADGDDDEEKCLALGAADFITKPYNASVVRMRISRIIKMKEYAAMYSVSEYDSLSGMYTKEAFCHHIDMLLGTAPDKKYDILVYSIGNIHSIEKFYGIEVSHKVISCAAESIKSSEPQALFYGRISESLFAAFFAHSSVFDDSYFKKQAARISEGSPAENLQVKFGLYKNVDITLSGFDIIGKAVSALESISGQYAVNVACYDEKIIEKQMKDDAMEKAFESAIEKEDFEVWYQPKYSAKTKKIIGAEGLIRWRGKDGKLIPPGEFIPLFERDGLISELDEYVFRKVCRYQKKRQDAGQLVIPISVNLSRASMFRRNFARNYISIASGIGIDPSLVPIEITETMALKSISLKSFADALIKEGFSLHMDDFGAGYSSLASLQILRFDVIKLDKSLVDFIGTSSGENLIRHTVAFARESGMSVVAEGVETEKQLAFLRDIGCDTIQGFYFSPPVPQSEFEKLLESQSVS
ncbi:EAL domain-containing protein [Treponema sp.]|uniref:EAL domain-containing protein n=1 Tax=Treponema sp. TaxID=166 RepID=UPI003F07C2EF